MNYKLYLKYLLIGLVLFFISLNLLFYLVAMISNPLDHDNLYDKHMTAYTRIYAIYFYMYYGSDRDIRNRESRS